MEKTSNGDITYLSSTSTSTVDGMRDDYTYSANGHTIGSQEATVVDELSPEPCQEDELASSKAEARRESLPPEYLPREVPYPRGRFDPMTKWMRCARDGIDWPIVVAQQAPGRHQACNPPGRETRKGFSDWSLRTNRWSRICLSHLWVRAYFWPARCRPGVGGAGWTVLGVCHLASPYAGVAQWLSSRLIIYWIWVRVPSPALGRVLLV
jgi:hypothetical protein